MHEGGQADQVGFAAVVEPLVWGRNTYTVIKVPDSLARAAAVAVTRRVAGTMDGLEVNIGLNRADVTADAFIYVGKPMLRRLGLGLGDVVDCVLAPAPPDLVPLPEDVATALRDSGLMDTFERLRAPQRRQLLVPIDAAARADTRARRIHDMLEQLSSC